LSLLLLFAFWKLLRTIFRFALVDLLSSYCDLNLLLIFNFSKSYRKPISIYFFL
jgi:hypothetical protein